MTHLSRVWRVLPEETHHQVMGTLLDTVCEHVTVGVLELTDISEDEVGQATSSKTPPSLSPFSWQTCRQFLWCSYQICALFYIASAKLSHMHMCPQTHQLHYLLSLVGFKAPSFFQGYSKGRGASDLVWVPHTRTIVWMGSTNQYGVLVVENVTFDACNIWNRGDRFSVTRCCSAQKMPAIVIVIVVDLLWLPHVLFYDE